MHFYFSKDKFPKFSEAKIKDIFVGPQIRELMNDTTFESKFNTHEMAAFQKWSQTF